MSGGGGVGDSGRASAEQRDRMLMQNERLQSQNSTIRNAIEMAEETEGVAMEISQELGRHREKIKVRRAKGGGACRRRANARERDAAARARYRAAERDMSVTWRARARQSIHGRVHETSDMAERARRLLGRMNRREVQQKIILGGVALILLGAIGVIIYYCIPGV